MKKVGMFVLVLMMVMTMSLTVMADNVADIDQSNGAEAFVEQIGSNETYLTQDTNGGAYNAFADIFQDGEDNLVYLNQNIWSAHNTARAYVNQEGEGNEAGLESEVLEQTNSAYIDIEQLGNFNAAFVSQTTNYKKDEANTFQEGDNNLVRLDQTNGKAWVEQLGDDNILRLEQNNAVFPEQNSETWFTQEGNENKFVGFDGESQTDWAVQNNSIFSGQQTGDNNTIGLYQGGDDVASIDQVGDSNTALLFQSETGSHDANIVQNGNSNSAEVVQTSN